MGGSIQLGRILGIPLRVHFTFLLLLAFFGYLGYRDGDAVGAVWSILFICALFGCVILHELSHSMVARYYGVEVESITLLPIGGVAAMKEMPRAPVQEGVMAIAGPIASMAIAAVFAGIIAVTGSLGPIVFQGQPLFGALMWTNIIIAIFNLIPAFPMDGGRVLRAVLAHYLGLVRATRVAVTLGQILAVGIALGGVFILGNLWLGLIGVFIFLGAGQEGRQVQTQALLASVTARQAMVQGFATLNRHWTIGATLAYIGQGYQRDFPVVDELTIVGIASRDALVNAYHQLGPDRLVGEVMSTAICQVTPEANMADVYRQMPPGACRVLLVLEGGAVIGLVTPDSIQERLVAASSGHLPPPARTV